MAWPPATYDVISRNHSIWSTITQLVSKCGRAINKKQLKKTPGAGVLSFKKNSEKPKTGVGGSQRLSHPPPLYFRGLTKAPKLSHFQVFFLFCLDISN